MKKAMRLLWLALFALLTTVSFTSCSDDDKNDDGGVIDPESSSLVGTWVRKEDSAKETLTFKANGTFRMTIEDEDYPEDNVSINGKYSVYGDIDDGASLRTKTVIEGESVDYTYVVKISGIYLYMTDEDGETWSYIKQAK